jgi:HSP20 family protein
MGYKKFSEVWHGFRYYKSRFINLTININERREIMSIIRHNPYANVDRVHSLRDLFDSAFALASDVASPIRSWYPAIEVHQDSDKFTVNLEAPGMKREDFDVSLDKEVLTISGERKQEREVREGETFQSERLYGRFQRSIALNAPVQAENVEAIYKDGVLTVILPKAEEAKSRKIEIKNS